MQQLTRKSGSPQPSTTWPVCAPPLASSWIHPCNIIPNCMFSKCSDILCQKHPSCKKRRGQECTSTCSWSNQRYDIKIWPRKHLQYRHFCASIFYCDSHYRIQLAVHVYMTTCACNIHNTTEMIKDITLHCYQN